MRVTQIHHHRVRQAREWLLPGLPGIALYRVGKSAICAAKVGPYTVWPVVVTGLNGFLVRFQDSALIR